MVLNLGTSACYMAVMPPAAMGDKIVEGIFGQVDGSILPRMIGFESGLSAFGDVYAWFKRLLCWPLREILARTELVDAPTRRWLPTGSTAVVRPSPTVRSRERSRG